MSELDPYPWRHLNNPTVRYGDFFDAYNGKAVFEPREGYEQDRAKYPL